MTERIADTSCRTGEGPLRPPDEGVLYWRDIPAGDLYRYDPETDDHGVVLDHDGHEAFWAVAADTTVERGLADPRRGVLPRGGGTRRIAGRDESRQRRRGAGTPRPGTDAQLTKHLSGLPR
ncbi:hypothetical protein [Halopelagius longus]|uniref:hypothetical protein n=1 Tax=Halopelagius longus TaxID=1236180 RepID=UPI000B862A0C